MATIIEDISRTFAEYLLLPRLTPRDLRTDSIRVAAPLTSDGRFQINIPVVSACMQAVSGTRLSISLARQGGLSMIYCSQGVATQADMVREVKAHKAGFVTSGANTTPGSTLASIVETMHRTGHSTIPVTNDGTANGMFCGLITDQDFWEFEDDLNNLVEQHMTPKHEVIFGEEGISLREANQLLHRHKKDCLPILAADGRLSALVFKKDYVDHQKNPNELLDQQKRLCVGAAINTHDFKDRVPALVEAGADVLCFDSSDGFTEFQLDAATWIREQYGEDVVIGMGNIVSGEAFDYLAESGIPDFIKVGIGGGSICITREQKGVGRGQASALMDVAAHRDQWYAKKGRYIPLCSDGGLSNDTQIVMALAMGADFVMMGRYFAMTEESPTEKISINGQMYKPYWGEGTRRAQNWQRYSEGMSTRKMMFEEGVDAFVRLVGPVSEALDVTIDKLKSTMMNTGASNLAQFRERAVLTLVSEQSIVEGGTSNVFKFSRNRDLDEADWGN